MFWFEFLYISTSRLLLLLSLLFISMINVNAAIVELQFDSQFDMAPGHQSRVLPGNRPTRIWQEQ